MTAPRLEIDLDKIYHNARTLVERLTKRGISVTGVTKATLGSPQIAATLLRAGATAIGDSRIEFLGASSDHLIVDPGCDHLFVGTEITFHLNYSALVRAMTSPFVDKVVVKLQGDPVPVPASHVDP